MTWPGGATQEFHPTSGQVIDAALDLQVAAIHQGSQGVAWISLGRERSNRNGKKPSRFGHCSESMAVWQGMASAYFVSIGQKQPDPSPLGLWWQPIYSCYQPNNTRTIVKKEIGSSATNKHSLSIASNHYDYTSRTVLILSALPFLHHRAQYIIQLYQVTDTTTPDASDTNTKTNLHKT